MEALEKVKQFWNDLGWIANAVQILTPLILVGSGLFGIIKHINKNSRNRQYKNIRDYVASRITVDDDVTRKIITVAKIAIVDDNPDDFPVDYLRRTGFHVDVIASISLAEVKRLEAYDLVMLDIVGVVVEDKKEGGLELIKRVKKLAVPPKIIAVSGKKFDPKATEFFKHADDVMSKPVNEKACEEHILNLIEEKLSPIKSAQQIDTIVSDANLTANEYRLLNTKLMQFLDGDIDVGNLKDELKNKYRFRDTSIIISFLDCIKKWIRGQ